MTIVADPFSTPLTDDILYISGLHGKKQPSPYFKHGQYVRVDIQGSLVDT